MNPTIEAEPVAPLRRQSNLMQLSFRIAAVVLALAGFWVSGELMKVSFDLRAISPLLDATCGTGNIDCLSVLRSDHAYITDKNGNRGLPWSVIGAAYFCSIALWYAFVGYPSRDRWYWHLGVTIAQGFAALVSAYLLSVMAYELRRWCMGCTIAHGINFGLLLLTLVGIFFSRKSETAPHPSLALGSATALLCIITFGWNLLGAQLTSQQRSASQVEQAYRSITGDPEYVLWKYERQPLVELPVSDGDIVLGDVNALNTVVTFIDMQCSHCKNVHKFLEDLTEKHPDVLRVAVRHFPNSNQCNAHFKALSHPAACAAARWVIAASASGDRHKAAKFIHGMFDAQRDLDAQPFAEIAERNGLDAEALARGAEDNATTLRLEVDAALGAKAGVTATPRVFLNGRVFEYWNNKAAWHRLLELPEPAAPATQETSPTE
ncbi:MAG: thioredoxin domain-containing protein [Phycisphaerales bacterium]|nr:thioredoxin domain-containing protein [Phycisphaerales bacterium]